MSPTPIASSVPSRSSITRGTVPTSHWSRRQSVEENDACAIYASVRKDATPSHEPIELAIPALQKMLHRAGNVDGEGDGCGLLLDLPRKIWAEEVRVGGHDPALTLDDAFAVAHVFIERSQDVEKIKHDARELLAEGGFRILAERESARSTRPRSARPRARRSRSSGRSPASSPTPSTATPSSSSCCSSWSAASASTSRRFSGTTCVYKVMGAPNVLGAYYPDLTDPRFETVGAFGHNRYSTNTWPSFKRVQPFSVARPQRRDQHDRTAAPGGEDAGGPDHPGRLRLAGPEPDDRHDGQPRGPLARRGDGDGAAADRRTRSARSPRSCSSFYMYLHQTMGPFAQGPVALIARHGDECVFSADAMGLRPLWKVETEIRLRLQLRAGRRLGPQDGLRAAADGPGREGDGDDRPRRAHLDPAPARADAADRPRPLAGAQRGRRRRPLRARAGDRRPARGRRRPRLLGSRPGRAGEGRRPRPGGLRLAARRRQTGPADGLQRGRADRLAGLRRPAGGALAGAAEPRRLLQGDGRRRHQPGARPRAGARALLDPHPVRPAARRSTRPPRTRRPSKPPSR